MPTAQGGPIGIQPWKRYLFNAIRDRSGCVRALLLFWTLTFQVFESHVQAGGGPQNVLVVVNSRSWASCTIANYFCALRDVPAGHVVYLDWQDSVDQTDIQKFRDKILGPVIQSIEQRHLAAQIDYIVYSSDLPYAISYKQELKNKQDRWPTASITGLTYLTPLVMAKREDFSAHNVNWYMRPWLMLRSDSQQPLPESRGFCTTYGWTADRKQVNKTGRHYILSTMLGFTSGRGNSVSEVIRGLRKSAGADGTFPPGTIYFAQNNDVRSVVRQHAFEPVARELRSLGIKSQIVQRIVPHGKSDIQGLTTGQAELNWTQSNNRILPGAICENFTSFGAVLAEHGTQTPLSVFIRAGAAGTCGTVAEPMAILNKFPHPMLHVHYARGCSLAEAFYQSVHGPYQLLIVGDPLCRPWAKIPKIGVKGLQAGQTVNGTLQITPTVLSPRDFQPRYFEIYLQGQKLAVVQPEESWDLDTTKLADGYLELRVVAVDSAAIQTQGYLTLPFTIDNNNNNQLEFSIRPKDSVSWNEKLTVTAACPGSSEIVIFQHRRVLAKIEGDQGQAEIDPRLLGMGQVTLSCIATGSKDTTTYVAAKPVRVHVAPPRPFAAKSAPTRNMVPGLLLRRSDGSKQIVKKTNQASWPSEKGIGPRQPYTLQGYFQVPTEDVYQFQLAVNGQAQLWIDGKQVFEKESPAYHFNYIPVAFREGWHQVQLRGTSPYAPRVHFAFGGPGTQTVGADRFRCRP
ncbi:MAG: hypothetical protein CMJ81_16840 [Planctomycetaceae bacterium]|jgi:hypothetical protein|nr:hypothetical protein [Planctomycetaceae bacterium]MBP62974.1 hypothetical protein [Planctomycetaceae bacterium]